MPPSRIKIALRAVSAAAVLIVLTAGGYPAAGTPPAALREALDEAVAAGNPGAIAYARDGAQQWQLAAGVADLATGRPAHPRMVRSVEVATPVAAGMPLQLSVWSRKLMKA